MIHIIIFVLKMTENMISTLRLIMISNGKKIAGSLLHFIGSIVFIISASLVIINFNKDVYKILAYALGCGFGSYFGSLLDEKMAIGENLIICISYNKNLSNYLQKNGYKITAIKGEKNMYILYALVPRRIKKLLINKVTEYDKNTHIIIENAIKIKHQ